MAAERGHGATLHDGAGGYLDGIVTDGIWVAGRGRRSALALNGSTSAVRVGESPELVMADVMSVAAWIRPAAGARGIIVSKDNHYELARNADGTVAFAFNNATPGWNRVQSTATAPDESWTHVALTYEQGVVRVYTNGVLQTTHPGAGAISGPPNAEFRIGDRQAVADRFRGQIADVAVYDRRLTSGKCASLSGRRSVAPTGGSTRGRAQPQPTGAIDGARAAAASNAAGSAG